MSSRMTPYQKQEQPDQGLLTEDREQDLLDWNR